MLGEVEGRTGTSSIEERLAKIEELLEETSREWFTAEEAARYLRLNLNDFYALAASGEIPRHQFGAGRQWRYFREELRDWGRSR